MEVVYQKTVLDKIHEAQAEASRKNRTIDFIRLNRAEVEELYKSDVLTLRMPSFLTPSYEDFKRSIAKGNFKLAGVKLALQEFV